MIAPGRTPSMTKSLIRNATGADFPILLSIDQACFPEGIAYDSAELSYFMNREQAETIVLEEDGQIAAFLIIEIRRLGRRRKAATMVTLDVRQEHRRKGHASTLLRRSIEILEGNGVRLYELQVDVHNASAIALYRKHGFEIARTIRNYYANGHDAYLMTK